MLNGGRAQAPECRGLAPHAQGTHCLANRPGSLVLGYYLSPFSGLSVCGFADIWRLFLEWTLREGSAHGRICTGTVRGLSALSLHWTTRAVAHWTAWQELRLHCRRFELRASALGYTRFCEKKPKGK
jgi:hypothetical protein